MLYIKIFANYYFNKCFTTGSRNLNKYSTTNWFFLTTIYFIRGRFYSCESGHVTAGCGPVPTDMHGSICWGHGEALCPLIFIRGVPEFFTSGQVLIMWHMLIRADHSCSFYANFWRKIQMYAFFVRGESVERLVFLYISVISSLRWWYFFRQRADVEGFYCQFFKIKYANISRSFHDPP